jgi:hypothetical protein
LSISAARFQDAATRLATSAARATRPADVRTGKFAEQSELLSTETLKNTANGGTARISDLANAQIPDNLMYTPSFTEDLVTMRLAVQAYKASAKAFQIQSDMSEVMLKLADSKR